MPSIHLRKYASVLCSTLLLLLLAACGGRGVPSNSSSAIGNTNSGGSNTGSSNPGNTGGGSGGSSGGSSTGATYVYASIDSDAGGVAGFALNSSGALAPVPGSPFSQPGAATLGALTAANGNVYTANLVDNTSGRAQVIQFKADAATGALTQIGTTDAGIGNSGATQMRHLFVNASKHAMYGLFQWTIVSYALDANGTPSAINSTNPSTDSVFGFDFMPNGPYAYATIQNGNPKVGFQQPQIVLLTIAADGSLTTSRAVAALSSYTDSDLKIDPSGKYVVAVTGNNLEQLAVFAIQSDGSLTEVAGSPFSTGTQGGSELGFDSTGKFLYLANWAAVQPQAVSLQVYSFDSSSGKLSQVQSITEPNQQNFAWLRVDGSRVYLTNSQGGTQSTITVYDRDPNTGQLTQASIASVSKAVAQTEPLHF